MSNILKINACVNTYSDKRATLCEENERDTCLLYPIQIRRHRFGKHLTCSTFVKLCTAFDATTLIGKFSCVIQWQMNEWMKEMRGKNTHTKLFSSKRWVLFDIEINFKLNRSVLVDLVWYFTRRKLNASETFQAFNLINGEHK